MSTSSTKYVIEEGNNVLLKRANRLRLFGVQRKKEIWLDKTRFYLDGVIGHPFGTTFEVKDGQMVKIAKPLTQDVDSSCKGLDQDKDNRNLHDLDSNQKLTADEIDQMKKDGVTGETLMRQLLPELSHLVLHYLQKLIEQLIENSATFQTKTEYAKEKWVKKKKKKHILEFTVLKPTSRLLCELYWSKGPSRICNLRIDTLGQILTWGNVHANTTVAVVDTCLSLVTGAVLERLGGFGKVVSFYSGGSPMKSPLTAYDFPPEVQETLYHFPLELVNSLHSDKTKVTETEQHADTTEAKSMESNCEETQDNIDLKLESDSVENDKNSDNCVVKNEEETDEIEAEAVDDTDNADEVTQEDLNGVEEKAAQQSNQGKGRKRKSIKDRDIARENRRQEIEKARSVLSQGNLDCLIVACKFHPTPIVTALVDLLAPSRQVVVFSQFKEALEDCYVYLREHGGLISYRLTETWLRNYQVLPNRTHPVIQMSGTGGYLLTATTVEKRHP